ncbi:Transposase DDE domain protein [Paenibacillus konkukensis]|uniref:Transposase DDE domain protein n=1 Tax=Paenibacillus konkukensis TaxID=2020716 RepID=A0ABY4RNA6_9BACL|nr:transposase [Paenibacillus konkukensis]UQZ83949.1 Transposase DDE domain protein [Paenibacillus konkukensis]
MPFAVFKELFQLLVRKCNRETRRKLAFPKELLLIDSATMTVGKSRLPWAPYHGERAAVKLHVALRAQNGQPLGVTETIGARHDGPVCETLENSGLYYGHGPCLRQTGAIGSLQTRRAILCHSASRQCSFRKTLCIAAAVAADSQIVRDFTCQLGTPQCRSKQRHRVVIFRDFEGREIRIVTDLLGVTAEQIALIYKARWQIEVFFRWIKQHVNVPTLFGTTENAIYGQLFSALIVFVLLKWLFDGAKLAFPRHAILSFVRFARLLLLGELPVEWSIRIDRMVNLRCGSL